tara:strand:- start:4777 stop:6813 length:2037 start_codon:yes stop_codon:yes gene_type:complete
MQQGGMARVPVPTPPAAMRPAAAPQGAMPPMRPATAPAARPTGQAAGIASMVSDKAMRDLDQAQGPEQMINAFRGDQKPLEARYQELAQYVGPQDATATPISVLTMVQPSLMMTAQGAADSGIGELMANVAGKVNMESAPGQANRMGQGLGNIMMSRQAPQPAGMAQGGVVGKFEKGGNPLVEYYKQDLPAFQEILAPSQGDKDAAKRQLFFDIAQRGLAMAGGAGGTGNVASQLANVFQTLPGTYAAQQAELRKGERAAQQAALQSASGRVQGDREQASKLAELNLEAKLKREEQNTKFIYDLTLARDKAMNENVDFDGLAVVDSDGTQLGIVNQNSPTFEADLASIRETNPNAQVVKIPDQKDLFPAADFPELTPSQIEGVFTDRGLLDKLSAGNIKPEELTRLNAAIAAKTEPRPVPTGEISDDGTRVMELRSSPLPNEWIEAINKATDLGVPVQLPNTSGVASGATRNVSPTTSEQLEETIVNDIPEITDSAFVDWNPADSFGSQAQADSFLNSVIPKIVNFATGSEFGAGSPEEIKAESQIKALNAFILQTLFSAASGNSGEKLGADERKVFADLIPAVGTPAKRAAGEYEAIITEFNNLIREKQFELSNPQGSFKDVQKIKSQINALENRSAQVQELVNALRRGGNSRANTPADIRSMESMYIKGAPVIGNQ